MSSCLSRCLFVLLLLLSAAGGAAEPFRTTEFGGEEYVALKDLWRWYGFSPRKGREGCVAYGAGNRTVSVMPRRQDFYVNSYRYILSFPVQELAGQLYISSVDVHKLVDPVLRPKFSTSAGSLRTVVLDPGHGGHDAGATSPYAREKDCNLAVAKRLRAKLLKLGFKVVMTRDGDYFLTLQQRVAIANKTPDSIFVSIHHNSGRSGAEGIETFTLAPHGTTGPFARTRRTEELSGNNQDSENIALATAVHSRAVKASKAVDRGIQRARFSVLCTIVRPAILFEGGFVSNPEEGRRIASAAYQELLAESLAQGIVSYSCIVCRHRPGALKPPTPGKGRLRTSAPGSHLHSLRRS